MYTVPSYIPPSKQVRCGLWTDFVHLDLQLKYKVSAGAGDFLT